jgi:DNA-binding XRE family transcriptional regulator
MGLTMVDLDRPMTQTDFAVLVGVSKQAVGGQIRKGALLKNQTAREWLLAYCDHLRKVSAGRSGGDQTSLTEARIEESQEKVKTLRQKRLTEAGDLIILDDMEAAILEIPSLFQSSIISAGSDIVDAIESKYGIELDETMVNKPLGDALRFVADHVQEFGNALQANSAIT